MLDIRVIAAVERALATGQPQKLEPYSRKRRPTEEQVVKLKATKEPQLIDVHEPQKGR